MFGEVSMQGGQHFAARNGSMMRPIGCLGILRWTLLVAIVLAMPRFALAAADNGYRLNAGDVLNISVWKEEDMQREVMVLPDGRISFPLSGHIVAAGKTVQTLEQVLGARLKKFFPNTVVSVAVKSIVGNKFFVIGGAACAEELASSLLSGQQAGCLSYGPSYRRHAGSKPRGRTRPIRGEGRHPGFATSGW